MAYFSTQIKRLCEACGKSLFWAEMFVIIPVSMLGIWWPVWFQWTGYDRYLMPSAWFTFGLGSLATIFIKRSLMSDSEDIYKRANIIFVSIFCLLGAILYGKALIFELDKKPPEDIFISVYALELAILLNVIVWIWHFVSRSEFDNTNPGNSLGEKYD
jgi:hypothetical protein